MCVCMRGRVCVCACVCVRAGACLGVEGMEGVGVGLCVRNTFGLDTQSAIQKLCF